MLRLAGNLTSAGAWVQHLQGHSTCLAEAARTWSISVAQEIVVGNYMQLTGTAMCFSMCCERENESTHAASKAGEHLRVNHNSRYMMLCKVTACVSCQDKQTCKSSAMMLSSPLSVLFIGPVTPTMSPMSIKVFRCLLTEPWLCVLRPGVATLCELGMSSILSVSDGGANWTGPQCTRADHRQQTCRDLYSLEALWCRGI